MLIGWFLVKRKMVRLHVWPEARCARADKDTDVWIWWRHRPFLTPGSWSWCDNERRTKDTANVLQWSPLVSSSPEIIYIPHSWIDFASMYVERFMLSSCENEMFRNFISWVTYHQLLIWSRPENSQRNLIRCKLFFVEIPTKWWVGRLDNVFYF